MSVVRQFAVRLRCCDDHYSYPDPPDLMTSIVTLGGGVGGGHGGQEVVQHHFYVATPGPQVLGIYSLNFP